jgi:polyphosphate kinase
VGAQVVYGIVGLKTHAKLVLATQRKSAGTARGRREATVLRRYAHPSTGNYNARTARLYTEQGDIEPIASVARAPSTMDFLQLP